MVSSTRIAFAADLPLEECARRLATQIKKLKFGVTHADEFTLEGGTRLLVIFGISTPMRGSTFWSFTTDGLRYVPFFIQAKADGDAKTLLVVATGGAEGFVPLDFGRNKRVAEWILDGLPGRAVDPPPLPRTAEPEEPIEWRDSAPGL